MGSPVIFNGRRTKLLTADGALLQSGRTIDYDGAINYITNSNAEIDLANWELYTENTPANRPFGFNNVGAPFQLTRDTAAPLSGNASFLLSIIGPSTDQGSGVKCNFTIDPAQRGQVLAVSLNYSITSTGNFQISNGSYPNFDGTVSTNSGNSTLQIFILDSAGQMLLVSPMVFTEKGPNRYEFNGSFITSLNTDAYTLYIHNVIDLPGSITFKFDNVYVGPQVPIAIPQGTAGEINLITLNSVHGPTETDNSNFEFSLGRWLRYANPAAIAPTTMTGGAPNIVLSRESQENQFSGILNGQAHGSMLLPAGASRQGQGISLLVPIPKAYRGRTLQFSFPFVVFASAIAEGDLRMFAVEVDSGIVITPVSISNISGTQGTQGIARCFIPISIGTTSIRIGIHVARTSTTAVTLHLDDIKLTPYASPIGLAGSDWQPYSIVVTGAGTIVPNYAEWRRVGDSIDVRARFAAGVVTASPLTASLPPGLVSAYQANSVLSGSFGGSFAGANYAGVAGIILSAAPSVIQFGLNNSRNIFTPLPADDYAGSGDDYAFAFSGIRIAGWSSNVTMASDPTALPGVLSVALTTGPQVVSAGASIIYDTVVKDAYSGYNLATGVYTASVPGTYLGNVNFQTSSSGTEVAVRKNNVIFVRIAQGVSSEPISGVFSVDLVAGDTLDINLINGTSGVVGSLFNRWSLARIPGSTSLAIDPIRSRVSFNTSPGLAANQWLGTTNTAVARFVNATTIGTAITYASSSTLGDTFTINEAGIYSGQALVFPTTSQPYGLGWTINCTNLTGNVTDLPTSQLLAHSFIDSVATKMFTVNFTQYLNAGDVIRVQGRVTLTLADASYTFGSILKIGS